MMDPFIRTIYFAYEFDKRFTDTYMAVDLDKYSKLRKRWSPKCVDKYLLISKNSYLLNDKEYSSIQEVINQM